MYERVIEIIVYLINEMRNNKPLAEVDVTELKTQGYTEVEIRTAFSWLFDQLTAGDHPLGRMMPAGSHSYRVFHDMEKMALSKEAQGYLLQIRELGLINDEELELIIERVMMAGYAPAGLDDVRSIAAAVIFGIDGSETAGRWTPFGDSDTVQ
ncbi:MAG: DUF494 family protein [Bacteroidota bacterium]